jgi:hypothetical protein
MGPVAQGLLRRQQKYLRSLHHVPGDDLDLGPSFPRLRIACYIYEPRDLPETALRQQITLVELAVEIFKPVRFEEIQSRCRPGPRDSFDMFCVFGIDPRFPTSTSRNSTHRKGGNLIALTVAEGAGILPPSSSNVQGRPWNVGSYGALEEPTRNFSLGLKDPLPTPLTASTIDFVLEYMEFGRAAVVAKWRDEPNIHLDCYPSVFASFISSVSVERPRQMTLTMYVRLAAQSRKVDTKYDNQIDYRELRGRSSAAFDDPGRVGVNPQGSSMDRQRMGIRHLGMHHACPLGKRPSFT